VPGSGFPVKSPGASGRRTWATRELRERVCR
jgi:hypothetical protein